MENAQGAYAPLGGPDRHGLGAAVHVVIGAEGDDTVGAGGDLPGPETAVFGG